MHLVVIRCKKFNIYKTTFAMTTYIVHIYFYETKRNIIVTLNLILYLSKIFIK